PVALQPCLQGGLWPFTSQGESEALVAASFAGHGGASAVGQPPLRAQLASGASFDRLPADQRSKLIARRAASGRACYFTLAINPRIALPTSSCAVPKLITVDTWLCPAK